MPGDKRRLRGLNEVQRATKRVLRSSSISKVESVNSTETGECAGSKPTEDTSSYDGDTVQRTAGSFIALSDGKTKISDNLAAVNAGKTDERHLSEDLIAQAASNFKPTVVSLASFEGDTMLVECTGVCIECLDPNDAKFLTSLSLCTSSDGKRMVSDNFRIEVSFPNEVLNGQVVYYDSYYGIAVVSTQHVPVCEGVRRLVLDHDEALKSSSEVVALWCSSSSDKLMAESGQLIGPLDGTVHKLMFSTCKITTAGVGGPLIDIDGNFVGMNYYSQMGDHSQKVITPCLPRNLILKCMEHSGIVRLETKQEGDGTIGSSTDTREICKSSTHGNFYLEGLFTMNPDHEKYVKQTAKSYGYPLPDLLHANMYMVNTFEENFVKDTWTKLGKDVASKMSESVVPLASFNGNARFFACTGVFIGKSKSFQTILTSASLVRISGNDSMRHNNLQIEVCLLNKRRARGKLTYCNFDYNIALVNIDETIPPRTIELQQPPVTTGTPVRAVGCLFDKCRLMATNGKVTEKSGTSDCNEHRISTCNITKAGIGGPLIDTCGNFVGMNFYGKKETPFLPASVLLKVLGEFIGQWPEDALPIIGNADEKRWKVPEPSWLSSPVESLVEIVCRQPT